jgi:2-polyprenyl-3-methyl-5-hydroxy-6-metoxy-1,4-benzoquinol methylase
MRPVDAKRIEFIRRHTLGGELILELGCGRGEIASLLSGEVVGVEIDEIELRHAVEAGVDARPGDARTWTDARLYDAVVASEVIEHVPDPERLLENAARHLSPGGTLVLTTPNGYGPYELRHHRLNPSVQLRQWNWIRRRFGRQPYIAGGIDHAQFFTWTRLRRLIEQAGFEILEIRHSDALLGGLNVPTALSRWDAHLADRLPRWAVSGWYVAARLTESKNRDAKGA